MKKISREDAKKLSLQRYYTGEPCIHGHIAERYTRDNACLPCRTEYNRKYAQSHPEVKRKCRRKYGRTEKGKANIKRYQEWYYSIPANQARKEVLVRKNQFKQNCPSWADLDKMQEFYVKKILLNNKAEEQERFEVDHIIPLKARHKTLRGEDGKLLEIACGLHSHQNLQVIKRTTNRKKRCFLPKEFE